jgi:ethanolamine utilization protein EutN
VKIGRVAGTVVSTINEPFFDGKRLLLCDVLDASGEPDGYTIAVDVVDAGVGETVLIIDEGNSARQIFGLVTGAIRAVVVGTVDELVIDGEERPIP